MRKRLLILLIFVLICAVIAIFAINLNKVEYSDFDKARTVNETVQIIGKPNISSEESEETGGRITFSFILTDKKQNSEKVVYYNVKPMNFDYAEYVVVRGSYRNNKFVADEILTKCPSKYESELEKRKSK